MWLHAEALTWADSAPMCRLPVHNAVSKGGLHVKVAAAPGQTMAAACQLGACRTDAQALCLRRANPQVSRSSQGCSTLGSCHHGCSRQIGCQLGSIWQTDVRNAVTPCYSCMLGAAVRIRQQVGTSPEGGALPCQ